MNNSKIRDFVRLAVLSVLFSEYTVARLEPIPTDDELSVLVNSDFFYLETLSEVCPKSEWQFIRKTWRIPPEKKKMWLHLLPGVGDDRDLTFSNYISFTALRKGPDRAMIFLDGLPNVVGPGRFLNVNWSPGGKWMQVGDTFTFYKVSDFPENIIKGIPYQEYFFSSVYNDPETEEEVLALDPDTFPTVSLWVDEDTLYTLRIPRDQYDKNEGTYLMRHRLADQEVDFYLKSVEGWKELSKRAGNDEDRATFFKTIWRFTNFLDVEDMDDRAGANRPIGVKYVLDDLPDVVLKHPDVVRQLKEFQESMEKFQKK